MDYTRFWTCVVADRLRTMQPSENEINWNKSICEKAMRYEGTIEKKLIRARVQAVEKLEFKVDHSYHQNKDENVWNTTRLDSSLKYENKKHKNNDNIYYIVYDWRRQFNNVLIITAIAIDAPLPISRRYAL